jgi:adenosine deaminase
MGIDPHLPLIDLHRHLDGNVRLQTILDIGRAHNLPLPAWDIEGLKPHVQVSQVQPGVMEFISKFKWMTGILVNLDTCRRIAYENMEDASREGLDYVELRFSPWFMASAHNLDPAGIVEAVVDGVQTGERDFKVHANLIGIISRTYGVEIAHLEMQALFSQRKHLIGLDLAGDETNWPAGLFEDHFYQARNAGWHIAVHAGESAGPESIWQALKKLGAQRIGHGVRAVDDPALMDFLRDRSIGIESNLTSNVQTSTVKDYASHPLKKFLEYGILATINTDDPGISAIDINYEYRVAAPAAGLTPEMIRQAQRNALEVAFLTTDEKSRLLRKKAK